MLNYSKDDVILVQSPFLDVLAKKVRPAIVVNAPHVSQDLLGIPQIEMALKEWLGCLKQT